MFDLIRKIDYEKFINKNKIGFEFQQDILNLFVNEISKNHKDRNNFNYATKLLEKLVKNNKLETIVLKLYAKNEGYSFEFKGINKEESYKINYEEYDFLSYINNGFLPPNLIDLVDKINYNLYYNGYIILEIRDFRKHVDRIENYNVHFMLLKPFNQSFSTDLLNITKTGEYLWNEEDIMELESKFLLSTSEPLCLSPNPLVSLSKSIISQNGLEETTNFLKKKQRNAYNLEFSSKILNIRRHHIIKTEFSNSIDNMIVKKLKSFSFKNADNWRKKKINYILPQNDTVMVKQFSKILNNKLKYNNEANLVPVEELILETVDATLKNNFSKLSLTRGSNNGLYYCQLSLNPEGLNSVLFQLGNYFDAERYVNQYLKIFSEYGKRVVNVKNNVFDKTNFKPFYESSSPINPILNENFSKKIHDFINIIRMKDKQIQDYCQFNSSKMNN